VSAMADAKISFIVPAYNVERHLVPCLDSLVGQTYRDIEIVVIDDGSPDGCGRIGDEYAARDGRVRIIHQENRGVSAARNAGMDAATGEWLCFVDGDDWVETELCEELVGHLTPELDVCFFSYYEVLPDKKKIVPGISAPPLIDCDEEIIKRLQLATLNLRSFYLGRLIDAPAVWARLWRRRFLAETGQRFVDGLALGEDILFNLSSLEHVRSGLYVNRPLYDYRVDGNSVLHRYNPGIARVYATFSDHAKRLVEELEKRDAFEEMLQFKIAKDFMMCAMLDFCHPDNPKPYAERKRDFSSWSEAEPFRTALERAVMRDCRFSEKVLARLIRRKRFGVVSLLFSLRGRWRGTEWR